MTEREAWLQIARDFNEYCRSGKRTRGMESGICWAVNQMCMDGITTGTQQMRMLARLRENFPDKPRRKHWYPPDVYHAAIRATHCQYLARAARRDDG